ncbi:MAG: hypothetical protein SFX18_18270 [Pirellulales bacterium]|nr:hypothetical protein [Pirellulales bacterium]
MTDDALTKLLADLEAEQPALEAQLVKLAADDEARLTELLAALDADNAWLEALQAQVAADDARITGIPPERLESI